MTDLVKVGEDIIPSSVLDTIRAEVKESFISQLLNIGFTPSMVAQCLRVDIAKVRRVGGFTPLEDKALATTIHSLFETAMLKARLQMEYGSPDVQVRTTLALLNNAARRYSGTETNDTTEVRVALDQLLIAERSRGSDTEAPDPYDQGQDGLPQEDQPWGAG